MRSLHDEEPNARIADVPAISESGGAVVLLDGRLGCFDCREPYGSPRFPDLVIPDSVWRLISPSKDDGGLLCPTCILGRLTAAGITTVGCFTSGPIQSVTEAQIRLTKGPAIQAPCKPTAQPTSRFIGLQRDEPARQVHYVEDERAPGKLAGHPKKRESGE